jgi:predicted metal-dependent hydrolase
MFRMGSGRRSTLGSQCRYTAGQGLDAQLLKLPKELGEYVIVHELVHLLAPNHGKVFKSFMLAYLPDWEDRETRLQKKAKSSP